MTTTLTENISNGKGGLYASKGDIVEVVSNEHGNVLIVKDKSGECFSVNVGKTTYEVLY